MGVRSTDTNGTPSNPKGLNARIDGHLLTYFRQNFGVGGGASSPPPPPPQGIQATGGVISDFETGGKYYRAHVFTTSGTFNVSALATGPTPNNVDFLVVGGGGAGGTQHSGGGGAGGFRTSMPEGPGGPSPSSESSLTAAVANYTITVGAGGAGAAAYTNSGGPKGGPGGFSNFAHPSPIRSEGGGGGGSWGPQNAGHKGACGGGSVSKSGETDITVTGNRVANSPTVAPNQGFPGGTSSPNGGGHGGWWRWCWRRWR